MTFLRSLWADLIEKHLWPIALVLLVALVAIPVVVGGGGEDLPDEAALGGAALTTGATGGLGALAQVFLDEPGATRFDRKGLLRDPFRQRAVPNTGTSGSGGATATATAPAPGTGTAGPATSELTLPPLTPGGNGKPSSGESGGGVGGGGGAGGGSGGGGSGGGGGAGGGDETTPTPDPKPRAPTLGDYVTEIRFGRTEEPRLRRTVARLTPLPTVERPFFVYLGVLTDRRTAVFLLSSDVKASGQAKCKPDTKICETIEMRAGQTAKLTVSNDDGSFTQYALTVDDVRRRGEDSGGNTPPATETKAAARKPSPDEDLGTDRYTYDDDTGLLRRVRASKRSEPGVQRVGIEGVAAIDLSGAERSRALALPKVLCRRC